jgi:hypothetical protein
VLRGLPALDSLVHRSIGAMLSVRLQCIAERVSRYLEVRNKPDVSATIPLGKKYGA